MTSTLVFSRPHGVSDFDWHLYEHQISHMLVDKNFQNIHGSVYQNHFVIFSNKKIDKKIIDSYVRLPSLTWYESELAFHKDGSKGRIVQESFIQTISFFQKMHTSIFGKNDFYKLPNHQEEIVNLNYLTKSSVYHLGNEFIPTSDFQINSQNLFSVMINEYLLSEYFTCIEISILFTIDDYSASTYLNISNLEIFIPSMRSSFNEAIDSGANLSYLVRTFRLKNQVSLLVYLSGDIDLAKKLLKNIIENINTEANVKPVNYSGIKNDFDSYFWLSLCRGKVFKPISLVFWSEICEQIKAKATEICSKDYRKDYIHNGSKLPITMHELRLVQNYPTIDVYLIEKIYKENYINFLDYKELIKYLNVILSNEDAHIILESSPSEIPYYLIVFICENCEYNNLVWRHIQYNINAYGTSFEKENIRYFCGLSKNDCELENLPFKNAIFLSLPITANHPNYNTLIK